MSSAHIFYIPVLILIGFFAGFFSGRRAAEQDLAAQQRRQKRRAAAAQQSRDSQPITAEHQQAPEPQHEQ